MSKLIDNRLLVGFREVGLETLIVVPASDFHHYLWFIRSRTSMV